MSCLVVIGAGAGAGVGTGVGTTGISDVLEMHIQSIQLVELD